MATMTAVICLFIIQAVVLMDNAAADPNIDIRPTQISLGISSVLDINCTFSLKNYPDMAALVSLSLLRANASGQNFQELAVITEFSPNSVNLVTQEKVSATGVHSQTGESYLHVLWEFPTSTQGGVYQCAAHGLDMLGHNVEFTNISTVTVDEANLNDIFEKLKEMETHEKFMENTISSMQNTISSQENHIQLLNNTVTQLQTWKQNTFAGHLELLGSYQDKEYYVSRENFQDINESLAVCRSFGGTLIEIDDVNEYNVIVGFLRHVNSDIQYVMIGGTDEQSEGNWVLPSTNQPMPYTAWYTGQPSVSTSANSADPEIDMNPTEIRIGISSTLEINCTISLKKYPDMAALVSLNLLWANTSGQDFQELAVITEFSPDSVNLVTQEKITTTGVLNETGESFLHALWEYPTATQGGVYQCVAHGVDVLGHCVELTNSSVVTVHEANLNDILEKLKEIETHEKTMENTISSLENKLENKMSSMKNHIQSLENTVTQLKNIVHQLERIGTYNGKEYYVSRENYQDINESSAFCKSLGGTLIEINEKDEYNAVVGFFQNIKSDHPRAIIGGTDEQSEGKWVLPSTNQPLPYTAWYTNRPSNTRSGNCLGMYKNYSWKMYDEFCHYNSPHPQHFFTCEIPSVWHTGQKK